jgi:V/A-type H+-transporting ATPase subunit C
MASALTKYSYINAKLRARISKILPDDFTDQLVRARTLLEAVQLFKDTDFSFIESIYNKTGDLKSVELELYKREITLYVEIERYVKDDVLRFVSTLSTVFEVESLKNALRLWFDRVIRKRDIGEPYLYLHREKIHHNIDFDGIINAQTVDEIVNTLAGTPYADPVERAKQWIEERKSIFLAEVHLDQYLYKKIEDELSRLEGQDQAIAKRFIGVEIDLQNISWLVRFKSVYDLPLDEALSYVLPSRNSGARDRITAAYHSQDVKEMLSGFLSRGYHGLDTILSQGVGDQTSRFVVIERILEQIMLFEVSKTLGGYPFTIGIILAYFILKKNELRRIVTILNAKFYEIPEERIRSRL